MIELIARLQERKRLPTPLRYLATTFIVFLFFALRYSLGDALPAYPFLLFFPAVILAGFLFNHGNALYALVLTACLSAYFFAPEEGKALAVILYLLVGGFLSFVIESLRDATLKLSKSVTALDEAHQHLAEVNNQKSLMLQEVYHRIKNDLHAAIGMLEVQALGIEDPQGRSALGAAGARLRVLGLAYERLRLREGTIETTVNTKNFLEGLCGDLRAGMVGIRPIALRVDADSVDIEGTRAVSVGLFVNELVTNALKYAFPDDREGNVVVRFKCVDEQCVLSVTDDGVGMKPDTTARPGSLGKRLVKSLVQQLGGTLETISPPGTSVKITFPLSVT